MNSADASQGRLGGELGHGGDGCHHTWSGGLHLRYTAPTTFRASRQSVAATPDERLGGSARFFRSLDAHPLRCQLDDCNLRTNLRTNLRASRHLLHMAGDLSLLTSPLPYLLVPPLMTTGVLQLKHLNKAMKAFPASTVVPTYYVTFTIASVVGSGIVFDEFANYHVRLNSVFVISTHTHTHT